MGQRTETYQIPFEQGGFNANPNIDLLPATAFIASSRNLNLHNGGREKRGGTAIQYILPDTPKVLGIYDFRMEDGDQFIVTATDGGKLLKNSTDVIKTGMSTSNKYWFMELRSKLYICDAGTKPQVWDGSAGSTSDIGTCPTDWTASSFPQMMFTHSNGASYRGIALGVPGHLDTAYISKQNDGDDYGDANGIRIVIPTNDAYGLVAGAEFGARAILFGRRKAYILNDSDTDTANWGYVPVQWEGGVASPWLLVKTPNDLIAMMDDGEIYSVLAVQEYGDYKAASIARPAYMHVWIKEHVDLTRISEFHALYDPVLRAIKFFVAMKGRTYVDTALVYFIDRKPEEAWTIHDNEASNSGYRAACSAVVKVAEGDYDVYTGGYAGEVWKLEESLRYDDVNGYTFTVHTPKLNFDQPRVGKPFVGGRLVVVPKGNTELSVKWWVDEVQQTTKTVSLVPVSALYGGSYFGSGSYGGEEILDALFELGQIGKRIELQFDNAIPGDDFFISAFYIDFKWLGKVPK
jgi:hypothetical protein